MVHRSRLLERLNVDLYPGGGFNRKLTLVSAPAGYGKTTLVSEWLHSAGYPFAWISLDENDNDPAVLLSYIVTALRQFQPNFGTSIQAMIQPMQLPPPQAILAALVNEIAAIPASFVLALDDYQVIHTTVIHQMMAFLLEHQPPQMHLVLMTREDPLLPIPRLRAQGLVLEVRQEELRFATEEAAQFFRNVMKIDLSKDEVAALANRTEGWIAGLQLAGLSLQGRSDVKAFIQDFTGSNRFILDYLLEEVLNQRPAEIQEFLLLTSILDRLCGSLCDAVTGRMNCQELLQGLEQVNLFIIPLDPSREWYRYHSLFAELLRYRLREQQDSQPAVMLHQRASQWYEAHGFLPDAIQHALEAQDWSRSVVLISQVNEAMLKRGEVVRLMNWYGRFPNEIVDSQLLLCLPYAWALALASQFEKADSLLAHLERQASENLPLLGEVTAVQAYLARSRGEYQNVIHLSQRALALLPPTNLTIRGNLLLNLGLAYWHSGHLRETEEVLKEILPTVQQTKNLFAQRTVDIFLARVLASRGKLKEAEVDFLQIIQNDVQVPINALAYLDLCTLWYEWNNLKKAAEYLEQGMKWGERSGNLEFQNAGYLLDAFLLLAGGEVDAARQVAEQAYARIRELPPATRDRSAACCVQVALVSGDLDLAGYWSKQMSAEVDAHPFYRFMGLTRPRLLIAQGFKEAADEQLRTWHEQALRADWGYGLVAVLVLRALAARMPEEGLGFLTEALRIAQPEGYIRTFADAGPALKPLLLEAALRGVMPDYVGRLLVAIEEKKAAPAQSRLIESLSEREIEVLRLVAAGLSNREIANKLVISSGTAKTHIHNICSKLDVQNRTQAVLRAKELALV